MSSLSNFPTEILEYITSMVTAVEQMRLWQCGDGILHLKLKKGGLKRTCLYSPGSTWMTWPRSYFTTFDRIEEVEWGANIGRSLCPTLELNLLPKTLKRLHLVCDDVFVLLSIQNVNMNALLPMLHTLRLSGSRLREENLKNLPTNLIELSVTSPDGRIESSRIFSDLPRSIETMDLLFDIVDQSEVENDLPSDLVSLTIDGIASNFNWFSKLPKSLKILRITLPRFDPDWTKLPPQIAELHIHSVPKSVLPQLPQSLKILELSQIQDKESEDKFVLPKNLTRFQLLEGTIHHSLLQQLPARLADLEVEVSVTEADYYPFFDPYSIKQNGFPFPTNLQCLSIEYINDDFCELLPPGLRTLRIGCGDVSSHGASHFPKSLTSLVAPVDLFYDDTTLSHLGYISDIELTIHSGLEVTISDDWVSYLLPSTSNARPHYPPTSADSKGQNHQVTSLTVREVRWFEDSDIPLTGYSFFVWLPKFTNLTTLVVWTTQSDDTDWLRFIPGTVTNLDLRLLQCCPTAAQLSLLPKCLIYLKLILDDDGSFLCDWEDETFQLLPRSLQEFYINVSFPNLTPRVYDYVPPNLWRTSLSYGATACDFKFMTPLDRLYGCHY